MELAQPCACRENPDAWSAYPEMVRHAAVSPSGKPPITRDAARPRPAKTPPSIRPAKKNIWCLLNQRNGRIRLVQRRKKASLMPGMWELRNHPSLHVGCPGRAVAQRFAIPSPLPTTQCTCFGMPALINAALAARSKWIAIDRIAQIPITGLTRKILKASGII